MTAAAPRVALRDDCAACLLLHTTLGLAGASTCTSCLAGTYSSATGTSSSATCASCEAGTYSSAGASRVCLLRCPLFPARHKLQTDIPYVRLHACMLVCCLVPMGPSPRCCGRCVGGCATTATAPAARTMLIEAMVATTHTRSPLDARKHAHRVSCYMRDVRARVSCVRVCASAVLVSGSYRRSI